MNTSQLAAAITAAAVLASCAGVSENPVAAVPNAGAPTEANSNLHALHVHTLGGEAKQLSDYRGRVLLVVNTASECGYTKQYTGLEALHRELAPEGFSVLGFPSNDFGGQEPGSAEEIQAFCSSKYDVTFPLFEKVVTKEDPEQAPVYAYLGGATGKLPGWNFCKYLVGKDGAPIAFYSSVTAPDDAELRRAIDAALSAP